jgi:hypothetical protein
MEIEFFFQAMARKELFDRFKITVSDEDDAIAILGSCLPEDEYKAFLLRNGILMTIGVMHREQN